MISINSPQLLVTATMKVPVFFQVLVSAVALEKCTDVSLISAVQENSRLNTPSFLTIENSGLMQCARECQLRSRCQSFNFDLESGRCRLLNITRNQTMASELVSVLGSVHSEKASWPTRLAGNCWNHSCPDNTVCQETVSNYTCVITHCVDPPTVDHGDFRKGSRDQVYWEVGAEVEYICDPKYRPADKRVCQLNGSWSTFYCNAVSDCKGVKACNKSYSDGEYWIILAMADKAVVKVYCHNMSTEKPVNYISLTGDNYSISPETCSEACGKTTYRKVRLFVWKSGVRLQLSDKTFAVTNGSCEPPRFGSVLGCRNGDNLCEDAGALRIDLSGTGLSLAPYYQWSGKDGAVAKVRASTDWTTVSVACLGEHCQECYPINKENSRQFSLNVSVTENGHPPEDSAVIPVCAEEN